MCCRLRALGLQPRTKAEAGDRKFPFVVFSAPPSGSEDYAAEVKLGFLLARIRGEHAAAPAAGIAVLSEAGCMPTTEARP
jgi:hypothetical protein